MPLVCLCQVVGVDIWYQLIHQHCLKLLGSELAYAAELHIIGESVSHDNDERLYLTVGNEVVHYLSRAALHRPACLVLTPAVLQVQHRVALLSALHQLAIACGQIYRSLLHLVQTLGIEPYLCQRSMRDIRAQGIEVLVGRWYLYATLPTASTKEIMCAGVVKHAAVNGNMVIVKARIHRSVCRSYPHAILILAQHGTTAATQSKTHDYRLGIWRHHTEARVALRVNHRILLSRLV